MVDTQGLVLKAFVTEANYHDLTVGSWLLPLPAQRFPRLQTLWADSAYWEEFVERVQAYGLAVEINNPASRTGFQPVPWRWVVERTFTWLGNYRRLSEDYEYGVATSDAMIYVAMVHLMVRRLARLQADP